MATCNASSLLADAIANGFYSLPNQFSEAVKLQLIKTASGTTSSIGSLITDACAAGFTCLDSHLSYAVGMQLVCNSTNGGSTCAAPAAPVPSVDLIGTNFLRIAFNTSLPLPNLDYLIQYGTVSGVYTGSVNASPVFFGHMQTFLSGLTPHTSYFIVVQSRDSEICVSANSSEITGGTI